MFVLSLKYDKLRRLFAVAIVLCLTAIGGIVYVFSPTDLPASRSGSFSMRAETPEERLAFFRQFSYEVSESPLEVKEIVIPEEFDDTYTQYNELQKKQGLDLSDYRGVRVKSWSYEILNYPGYENSDGKIRGNILTYGGTVIGCDVSNIELSGFMEALM